MEKKYILLLLFGKYGRYLGIIHLNGENINDWLIENKLGVKADY